MKVGPMRQRVTLQTLTKSKDRYGQEIEVWTTVNTYWAEIVTLSGREAVNARQIKAESTHRITMRYEGTVIDETMRFLFNSRVLKVSWVNNVEQRNREYLILCTEVKSPTGI